MSNEVEILGSVIEFSIGLAGFSGVVAAFTNRDRWGPIENYRLVNLLVCSLIPGFSSFFALAALEFRSDVVDPWKISSVVLLLSISGFIYRVFAARSRMPDSDRKLVNARMFVILNGLMLLVASVLIANVLGLFGHLSFLVFYLGLVSLLFVGVILFGIAVLGRQATKDSSSTVREDV